jgi:hypothetical protein
MSRHIMIFTNGSEEESAATGTQPQPIDTVSLHLQNTVIKSTIEHSHANGNQKSYGN